MPADTGKRGKRIPLALQAVFLASNRGDTVDKPPPGKVASRVFRKLFTSVLRKKKLTSKQTIGKDQSFSTDATGTDSCEIPDEIKVFTSSSSSKKKSIKLTPQSYLDAMMKSRGYPVESYESLKTAYYNKPTAMQEASYDVHLVKIAKNGDEDSLVALLQAGISRNPCNAFGDSIVHTICRLGKDPDLLTAMLLAGTDLQVADDFGRTVLHDACWASTPNFTMVTQILDVDVHLLQLRDSRGALPLSYVQKQHVDVWIDFFQTHKDRYWPDNDCVVDTPPPLSLHPPNSRPVPDPPNALPLNIARMVASGKMSPQEVAILLEDGSTDDELSDDEDDDGIAGSDDDYSTVCSDDYSSQDGESQHCGRVKFPFDECDSDDEDDTHHDSVVKGFEDELSETDSVLNELQELRGLLGIQSSCYGVPPKSKEFESEQVHPVREISVQMELPPVLEFSVQDLDVVSKYRLPSVGGMFANPIHDDGLLPFSC